MTMPNIPDIAQQIADQQNSEQLFVATVTDLDGDKVKVKRIGSFSGMTMSIPFIKVNSVVGDQVLVIQVHGAYWVIGSSSVGPP